MSGITSPTNRSAFNLGALDTMAKGVGDNDKIRGKVNKSTFGSDSVKLYSSTKATGKYQVDKRGPKQQLAQSLVQSALDNTLAQIPPNKKIGLQQALNHIMTQHFGGGTKELTGQELKQIVAEAKQAISLAEHSAHMVEAQSFINGHLNTLTVHPPQVPVVGHDFMDVQGSQLSKTSSYDDVQARSGQNPTVTGTPIRDLSIEKHNQSVFRLPNKLDLQITMPNGTTIQAAKIVPQHQAPSREAFLGALFTQVNTALGRPTFDIRERVENYSKFGTGSQQEHLNAFTGGVRTDGGANQDIFMLKFATKEMAGFGICTAHKGLDTYCKSQGMQGQYSLAMRDQVEACHITMDPMGTGNFIVDSHVHLPLKNANNEVIGQIKMSLHAEVDSLTGDTAIDVNMSNLTFTDKATGTDKLHLLSAYSETLPGGV